MCSVCFISWFMLKLWSTYNHWLWQIDTIYPCIWCHSIIYSEGEKNEPSSMPIKRDRFIFNLKASELAPFIIQLWGHCLGPKTNWHLSVEYKKRTRSLVHIHAPITNSHLKFYTSIHSELILKLQIGFHCCRCRQQPSSSSEGYQNHFGVAFKRII